MGKQFYRSPLFWACVVTILLLSLFLSLQAAGSSLIGLPVQWIWLSVLPILLAVIVGGYVGKLKIPGVVDFEPGLQNLRYYPPSPLPAQPPARGAAFKRGSGEWTDERAKEYERTSNLFLVHVCKLSTRPGQRYDVTIFLMRHAPGHAPNQKEGFSDVERAEFYFGESWGNQVFTAPNEGGFIGVSTSAWGTFLATCRVMFKDTQKGPVILHRYIDFEMAPEKA